MILRLGYVDPEHFPTPDGWTAVGFLDAGVVLAYDPDRVPHRVADGIPTPLDPVVVNAAVGLAAENAARRLWPDGWAYAMSEAFQVNKRTLQRDRLAKSGLHPRFLKTLGSVSDGPDAAAMGALLIVLAKYARDHGEAPLFVDRLVDAERAAAHAISALRDVQRGRPLREE